MSIKDNPEFEEGPFFLVEGATFTQLSKKAIVWATDENTARNVFGTRSVQASIHTHSTLIGSLEDVKRDYRLTSAQITDLHREGYLKI